MSDDEWNKLKNIQDAIQRCWMRVEFELQKSKKHDLCNFNMEVDMDRKGDNLFCAMFNAQLLIDCDDETFIGLWNNPGNIMVAPTKKIEQDIYKRAKELGL